MQKDMHYYGTYAMAVAAGIPKNDAAVIAYAAQFVDDATNDNSGVHQDGGMLWGITTAHHPDQVARNAPIDFLCKYEDQRKMWVPFHFFPGGAGETFHEKLLCLKDGPIVNEMLDNHLAVVAIKDDQGREKKKAYALELMGICAHVYTDTFSHYGFSGMSSDYNKIVKTSFKFIEEPNPTIKTYIQDKWNKFFASKAHVLALGHGSVATMPDRPYLNWEFNFERGRYGNGTTNQRNNLETFLEACEKLHSFFSRFAKIWYTHSAQVPFDNIRGTVYEILDFEGQEDERISQWRESDLTQGIPHYDPRAWENERALFVNKAKSQDSISSHLYRFHQAAAYHRYYVLKDLLPAHGIAVY
ncbi:MAG: hypothetical protein FWG04_03630 [Desulfovibrionaceae bacterium]|nr:hypothetical protein [Desulfovibrionaceae bacterium]